MTRAGSLPRGEGWGRDGTQLQPESSGRHGNRWLGKAGPEVEALSQAPASRAQSIGQRLNQGTRLWVPSSFPLHRQNRSIPTSGYPGSWASCICPQVLPAEMRGAKAESEPLGSENMAARTGHRLPGGMGSGDTQDSGLTKVPRSLGLSLLLFWMGKLRS